MNMSLVKSANVVRHSASIVDSNGSPMASTFHSASDKLSAELARWMPALTSADSEWIGERDDATARIHDLARNDGWMSGAVTRAVDQAIGADFRCVPRPDWEALDLPFDWAVAWSRKTAAKFRTYCNDPRRFIDASQRSTLAGLMGQAYRHDWMDGEALAVAHWMTNPGRTYATSLQIIDPDRLSNPNGRMETATLRGGVECDAYGAPMAYHIRKSHPGDYMMGSEAYVWERVEKYVPGLQRRRVIHHFDPSRARAGQTRGKSILVPIVQPLRMSQQSQRYELQASVANSVLAFFLESPMDPAMMGNQLNTNGLGAYQELRKQYHDKRFTVADGVRVIPLVAGEKINSIKPEHPNAQYAAFQEHILRHIATATGQSYEEFSQDWTKTNYSSARAALMGSWKTLIARRGHFTQGFATPLYLLWLEEAIDKGEVEMPPGAPDFWEMPAAWGRCWWICPGRGWIDPVKEAQAADIRIKRNISTLQKEAADQGEDSEEILEQRAYERARTKELGLPEDDTVPSNANYDGDPNTEDNDARDARERNESLASGR